MDDSLASRLPCPPQWRRPDGTLRTHATKGGPDTVGVDVAGARQQGLLIPMRRTSTAAGVLLLVLGLGLLGLTALLAYNGFSGGSGLAIAGMVVVGVLGLLFVLAAIAALRPQQARNIGFVLTSTHLVVTWAEPDVVLRWEDVAEIRPLAVRLGKRRTAPAQNFLGVVARERAVAEDVGTRVRAVAARFGKDVACAVPVGRADVHPLVLLHSLRFYLGDAAARAELAGPDAVRRVREVRFGQAD